MATDEPVEAIDHHIDGCTYLGGSYSRLEVGKDVSISFEGDMVLIRLPPSTPSSRWSARTTKPLAPQPIRIPFPEILSINISGPGEVTTSAGLIGGGFGVAGALGGMALAGMVNALTSRTKIHTFLEIFTHRHEAFFHYGGMEPSALRIFLSPVFARLRQIDPRLVLGQLERLAALREKAWFPKRSSLA